MLHVAAPPGTSYLDFVESMHLPAQLAEVDPIVASFCGGAVGAVSALLVVEINNVKKQQKNRCAGRMTLPAGMLQYSRLSTTACSKASSACDWLGAVRSPRTGCFLCLFFLYSMGLLPSRLLSSHICTGLYPWCSCTVSLLLC